MMAFLKPIPPHVFVALSLLRERFVFLIERTVYHP
jgi:hypothetical protein